MKVRAISPLIISTVMLCWIATLGHARSLCGAAQQEAQNNCRFGDSPMCTNARLIAQGLCASASNSKDDDAEEENEDERDEQEHDTAAARSESSRTTASRASSSLCAANLAHVIPRLSPLLRDQPAAIDALRRPLDPQLGSREQLDKMIVYAKVQIDEFRSQQRTSQACADQTRPSGLVTSDDVDYSHEPRNAREACLHAARLAEDGIITNEALLEALQCRKRNGF